MIVWQVKTTTYMGVTTGLIGTYPTHDRAKYAEKAHFGWATTVSVNIPDGVVSERQAIERNRKALAPEQKATYTDFQAMEAYRIYKPRQEVEIGCRSCGTKVTVLAGDDCFCSACGNPIKVSQYKFVQMKWEDWDLLRRLCSAEDNGILTDKGRKEYSRLLKVTRLMKAHPARYKGECFCKACVDSSVDSTGQGET